MLRPHHGWREVEIAECGEPLVAVGGPDGAGQRGIVHSATTAPVLVRQSVAERLVRAAAALGPGRGLQVVEGHRSHRRQDDLFRERLYRLAAIYPDWPPDALEEVAAEVIEVPSRSTVAPPPHRTGGAVNVTLCHDDGQPIDLGGDIGVSGRSASPGAHDMSGDPLQGPRRELFWALAATGMVVDVDRWWHWSYGNQRWAVVTGGRAIYGPIDPSGTPDDRMVR